MGSRQTFITPLLKENPVTLHVLGICSALAITNSLTSSLIMSVAMTAVLVITNTAISLIRRHLPASVRIIVQITIIASAVTIIDQFLTAYLPDAARTLSVYISLIVTNCIVLGRAEACAMKSGVGTSSALLEIPSLARNRHAPTAEWQQPAPIDLAMRLREGNLVRHRRHPRAGGQARPRRARAR